MSFAHALSQRLREEEENDSHVDEGYWYPSQLGFCDRSAVLQHAGVEEIPHDDRTLRVFYTGRIVHQAIQDLHPWEVVGHELRVRNEEYKVSGKIDSLARLPDGTLEVQEFKTMNSRSFSYADLPKKEHLYQIGVYLLWPSSYEVEPGVWTFHPVPDRGRLVYISKDDLRVEEYIVTIGPELEGQIKNKLVSLENAYQKYLVDGSLPTPLMPVEKVSRGKKKIEMAWQTRYCGFRGSGKCCGDVTDVGDFVSEIDAERDDSPEGSVSSGE